MVTEPSTRGHGLCVLGDVMVVKVQYRLGLWGFLKLEGGHANNGIWDQVRHPSRHTNGAGKKEGSRG